LKDERGLEVYENRLLKRISESEKEAVRGRRSTLYSYIEELHSLLSAADLIGLTKLKIMSDLSK
jgi:hypothetical protein